MTQSIATLWHWALSPEATQAAQRNCRRLVTRHKVHITTPLPCPASGMRLPPITSLSGCRHLCPFDMRLTLSLTMLSRAACAACTFMCALHRCPCVDRQLCMQLRALPRLPLQGLGCSLLCLQHTRHTAVRMLMLQIMP